MTNSKKISKKTLDKLKSSLYNVDIRSKERKEKEKENAKRNQRNLGLLRVLLRADEWRATRSRNLPMLWRTLRSGLRGLELLKKNICSVLTNQKSLLYLGKRRKEKEKENGNQDHQNENRQRSNLRHL